MTAPGAAVRWSDYGACDDCPARRGGPCYRLSSGGPEASAPVFADRPHPHRPLVGAARPAASGPPKPARAERAPSLPARRTAARTDSTVAAWQRLAARKGKT